MSRTLLALSVALALVACTPQSARHDRDASKASTAAVVSADQQFASLSQRWLDGTMAASPVTATTVGDHRHDAELDDLSADGLHRSLEFSRGMLADLEKIDRSALSRENQVDYGMLHNQLRSDIWANETLRSWAWDPTFYSQLAGGALYGLMAREFAPLPDRLRAATSRMEKLPALFAQMRANLDPARVPRVHAETVSKQNKGVLSLVDGLILPHAKELPDADRQRLEAAAANLRKAVDEQQHWLDTQLVPKAKGDFRIGAERYDAKLAFALNSPLTRQEIRTRAEAALKSTREQMYAIARTVLAGKRKAPALPEHPTDAQQQKAIQAALELAYKDRPARDKVLQTAEDALARATAFVREKGLVSLPDAPVKIITMPEFQRGVALAYCDPPGPLDKGLDTFYAVSPIPDDWSKKQVDSFLREYNTRSIHELTIHEAMPGHYLQLWHSNKYPSTLRAVLYSGAFVEGWAVYAEKVMADEGYLDRDPLYRLVHLKWDLRAIANAILDQAIHVEGMSRAEAMKLMTVGTFQEEREAAGKWTRAQLTSAQLPTYFVGWQEHLDLRKEAEQKAGAAFDLRAYHDKLLSFGSPPVRYARELMLDLPID
ncbi:uncharacterized protein (DUF885 family) [Dokdonella fugitiva]|uniref:Uncharacterized protein (DUF885 family) n=1 Tax=Dokdonella fugitiva TaxID=328517 RepID=A0A839ERW5_9GAMM|nr:DUF885 domain-containing protein [Dokdonella fugitiva]MBA8886495.1 uncharacterized protein (DUF885 family) [Dokdonella fugitiva]